MHDELEKHQHDVEAIQFIADMLEVGDSEMDEFAQVLRANRQNPTKLARIMENCSK